MIMHVTVTQMYKIRASVIKCDLKDDLKRDLNVVKK